MILNDISKNTPKDKLFRFINLNNSYDVFVNSLVNDCKNSNINYFYFDSNISLPDNQLLLNKLNASKKLFTIENYKKDKTYTIIRKSYLIPNVDDNLFKTSLDKILSIYFDNKPNVNDSIYNNFICKFLLWFNEYYKYKIFIYYGDIKKHDIYFLLFLYFMNYDVYLFLKNDSTYKTIDKNNSFSYELDINNIIGKYTQKNVQRNISNNVIKNTSKAVNKTISNKVTTKLEIDIKNLFSNCLKSKLIESNNIFEDIFVKTDKRRYFIDKPYPLIPNYFYRIIGMPSNKDMQTEYMNNIYRLDTRILSENIGYIKYTQGIDNYVDRDIVNTVKSIETRDINSFVQKIIDKNLLPTSNITYMKKSIQDSFKTIIYLYLENNKNFNMQKALNFIAKFLSWINKYYTILFLENIEIQNPKILYYGDIKEHECYLLIYFSLLGCDILYINTDETKDTFKEFSLFEDYTILDKKPLSIDLPPFPKDEIRVRKSTNASQAQEEIHHIMYSDTSVGFYKPWQFEDGTTKPITLQTTYDEIKILWQEPAKMRPEFKVTNNTVYIPNIFAKINGVEEDINKYFSDLFYFKDSKNTLLYKSLPFLNINNDKDKYKFAFFINNNATLKRDDLKNSEYYKLHHLRNSLQEFYIDKIEETINNKNFAFTIGKEERLDILYTLLNIPGEILNLLEIFDYTDYIPKIIIYNSSTTICSKYEIYLLSFLNSIGFDIIIYAPTKYNIIEHGIKDSIYDLHNLPNIEHNIEIPSKIKNTKSFFNKFFK